MRSVSPVVLTTTNIICVFFLESTRQIKEKKNHKKRITCVLYLLMAILRLKSSRLIGNVEQGQVIRAKIRLASKDVFTSVFVSVFSKDHFAHVDLQMDCR